jgi:hypothetical protein
VKKRPGKASGITDAQARAIGHLTISFNSLEQAVERFISLIVSPRDYGLDMPLIAPLPFTRKLDVLMILAQSLSEHYVPTGDNDRAYSHFLSGTKDLISKARALNKFRNEIIHWRLDAGKEQITITATASEIEARSAEMQDVTISMLARAIGLRRGDYSISFGQQFAETGKKGGPLGAGKGS